MKICTDDILSAIIKDMLFRGISLGFYIFRNRGAKMSSDKFGMKGLTCDDVLLVPAKSDVLPYKVDVSTNLTKDI